MTFSEQVAVILEAIDDELLQPEDVVRWADLVIAATEQPPSWLLELSALGSPHMHDYVSRLRERVQARLSIHRRIEVIVFAYNSGRLTFRNMLPLLFRVTMIEHNGERDPVAERLAGALVSWDCQEDLDAIEPPLRPRFEAIFPEVLRGAHELAAVLPWRLRAEPDAPPNGGPATRSGNSGVSEGPPSVS